jgi:hypothetical protein
MTNWMIGQDSFSALYALDPALTEKFFNTPNGYVFGHVPKGWVTNVVENYTSFGAYANDPIVRPWVQYTPEKWALTPTIEQQHPRALMQTFIALAHSRQEKSIVAPGRNLMLVPGADCNQQIGETVDQAYLRCQMPESGLGADVFICQAQSEQHIASMYKNIVLEAGAQTSGAEQFWAGLTTLQGDDVPTMMAAYNSVVGTIDGFWLNTNPATIQTAQQFLTAVEGS